MMTSPACLIRFQVHNRAVHLSRSPVSLEVDIQTAYEAQEAAETTARDLESRIRKIHCAAGLLPPRQYGQPIDRDAIAKTLTRPGV